MRIATRRTAPARFTCSVCENGLSPVVAIFVRGDIAADRAAGLKKLIKSTDELIPKYRGDKLAAFVMFLKLESGTKDVRVKKADGHRRHGTGAGAEGIP